MSGRLELMFMPLNNSPTPTPATDQQLLLQLVYGLCGQISNPREEAISCFVSAVGIPNPEVRRLAKLLVERCELPIPVERVNEWIEWQRTNQCYIISADMAAEAKRLSTLENN